MSDGSLYIMHTEPSDQGEYTVTANNLDGSSHQVINVTVIQPVALHRKSCLKPLYTYHTIGTLNNHLLLCANKL